MFYPNDQTAERYCPRCKRAPKNHIYNFPHWSQLLLPHPLRLKSIGRGVKSKTCVIIVLIDRWQIEHIQNTKWQKVQWYTEHWPGRECIEIIAHSQSFEESEWARKLGTTLSNTFDQWNWNGLGFENKHYSKQKIFPKSQVHTRWD